MHLLQPGLLGGLVVGLVVAVDAVEPAAADDDAVGYGGSGSSPAPDAAGYGD